MLTAEQTALLVEADLMDRRLQLTATGATIHRVNNVRLPIVGAASTLRAARTVDEAKQSEVSLRRAIRAAEMYLALVKPTYRF